MAYRSIMAQEITQLNEGAGSLLAQSERLVRPVAIRRGFGLLAHTQGNFFRFIYCKLDRLDSGSLVGPVTERLVP